MYDTYQRRVAECDQQQQKHVTGFADTVRPPAKGELSPKKKGKQNKNNPHFHLADELERITGDDLTRIDGVDVMVAQTLVSEVGLDMNRWKPKRTSPPGWGSAPTTGSVETRCSLEVRDMSSTERPQHSGWGPPPYCEARPTSRTVPTLAHQARRPQSHHRHGPSAGPTRRSNVEVWSAVRRQRCGILRAKKPPTTNRVRQKEGCSTQPKGDTSRCLKTLNHEVSGE
jgi:hypothetical protein